MVLSVSWFNISWTSNMDGPGTRTVLFLTGCHLRCPWCHSPHLWNRIPGLMFFEEQCQMCGACQEACPNDVHILKNNKHNICRDRCKSCGKCVRACPTVLSSKNISGALALPRFNSEPDELSNTLEPQLELLKDIGGLTISGGEPLLQYRALVPLLKRCRDSGYHTAIETSGSVPKQNIRRLQDLVDCWLFGLRPVSLKANSKGIVADMDIVEKNLRLISKSGQVRIIIRTPIIPGYTNNHYTLETIARLMDECGLSEIELLPFNQHSRFYYDALGLVFPISRATGIAENDLINTRCFFQEKGINVRII